MNHSALPTIGLAVAMTVTTSTSAQELDHLIKKVTVAGGGSRASLAYRELFSAAGPEGISVLKRDSDDSIAIQAAWEEVRLTVPEEQGPKVYRPKKNKLVSFVGFLEARSRSTVPKWWAECVRDARAHRRDNIYGGKPTKSPYHNAGLKHVNAPIGTTVKQDGKQCSVHVGDASIALPSELVVLSDDGSLYRNVSATFTKKECFVAIHGDVGYSHVVACIDRESEKIRWKSKACGCCWWGGATGVSIGGGVVTVVVHEDRVAVFGKSSGFYAHGFSRDDGKTLFRFSSEF